MTSEQSRHIVKLVYNHIACQRLNFTVYCSRRRPRRSRSICNMTARVLLPTLRPLRGNPQRFNRPFLSLAITRHSSTSSTSSPTHPCPSCGTPVPLASSPCPSCSTLLPIPSGLSHHSILSLSTPIPRGTATSKSGLPCEFDTPAELSTLPAHGYDLDARDLRQRMLGRQRELHPDKFASRGDRVVQMARELSGRVNKAYDVLGNPLKRAEYIVSRVRHRQSNCDIRGQSEVLGCWRTSCVGLLNRGSSRSTVCDPRKQTA
jgi:hypothetical protein